MSSDLIQQILNQSGITIEQLRSLSDVNKTDMYKTLKSKITTYKKNRESAIRHYYEKIKKDEIRALYTECDNTENNILSKLDISVIKRKKTITKGIKESVWRRKYNTQFNGLCCICNQRTIERDNFECGHIVPESKGGSSEIYNLIPICQKCNKFMSNGNMIEYVNNIYPIQDLNIIFDKLITPYCIFNLNIISNTEYTPYTVPDLSHINQYMYIMDTSFSKLNSDNNYLLNMEVMTQSNIITQEGVLNLSKYTGNPSDKCYIINIAYLYHYIRIVSQDNRIVSQNATSDTMDTDMDDIFINPNLPKENIKLSNQYYPLRNNKKEPPMKSFTWT